MELRAGLVQTVDLSPQRKAPLLATWTTGEDKYMNLALNLALSVRRNAPHLERTGGHGVNWAISGL